MNSSLITLEILVALLGLGVLTADLWLSQENRKYLAYLAAAGTACILVFSLGELIPATGSAFNGMYIVDSLSRFFKPFFLLAAMVVIVLVAEMGDRVGTGLSEFVSLTLMACAGMMLAVSSNDFVLMFVALELITVTFYVLNSFQRSRVASLEAGIKYLILGALSSAFMVFGIAFVFGATNTTNFAAIHARQAELVQSPVLLAGLLFVLVGLGFKIAAFPFQVWAPDVYQGAPAPAVAFLAVGSKTAGMVLLLRVLFSAVPAVTSQWHQLLVVMGAVTTLYGSLGALPQRSFKRLMGYSSIANAGYLLLGVAAATTAGSAAVAFYLAGYFFTVLTAFAVISMVLAHAADGQESDELRALGGLGQRSPALAAAMTLAMASLAGIPPLAGFFGKFVLLRALLEQGKANSTYYVLGAILVVSAVLSIYYYFGVVRSMYWGTANQSSAIRLSLPIQIVLAICVLGMLYVGIVPDGTWNLAVRAVEALKPAVVAAVKH